MLFIGWRDWTIAVLSLLDCWFSVCLFSSRNFVHRLGALYHVFYIYLVPFSFLLHYLIDGLRWQLFPLYFQLFLALLTLILWPLTLYIRVLHVLIKLLLTSLSFALCYIFPIPVFPPLEGVWETGVEDFTFPLDPSSNAQSRATSRAYKPAPYKKLHCLVFYPVDDYSICRKSLYPWLPFQASKVLSRLLHLPSSFFKYLESVQTRSMMVAPLSRKRKKYPLIYFSHDIAMLPTFHSGLCENLASQGFIVVAVHHMDGSALMGPESGSTSQCLNFIGSFSYRTLSVKQAPRQCPADPTSNAARLDFDRQLRHDAEALQELCGNLSFLPAIKMGSSSKPGQNERPSRSSLDLRQTQLRNRVMELRAAHQNVILLSETSGSWIKDRIDWDTTSVAGFGFGGAAALLTAISYSSSDNDKAKQVFNSCILICPWLDPIEKSDLQGCDLECLSDTRTNETDQQSLGRMYPKNFMIITTADQTPQKPSNLIRLVKRIKDHVQGDRILVRVKRCTDFDLTDIPMISPKLFRWLRVSGSRNCYKSQMITIQLIVNFLNHQYRHSLFVLPHLRQARLRRKKRLTADALRNAGKSFSGGSESEVAQGLSIGSISDGSVTTTMSAHVSEPRRSNRRKYSPSTMQALRLLGINEHYIRSLEGFSVQGASKPTWGPGEAPIVPKKSTMFDLIDGVSKYFDEVDRAIQRTSEKQVNFENTVTEVCHL